MAQNARRWWHLVPFFFLSEHALATNKQTTLETMRSQVEQQQQLSKQRLNDLLAS